MPVLALPSVGIGPTSFALLASPASAGRSLASSSLAKPLALAFAGVSGHVLGEASSWLLGSSLGGSAFLATSAPIAVMGCGSLALASSIGVEDGWSSGAAIPLRAYPVTRNWAADGCGLQRDENATLALAGVAMRVAHEIGFRAFGTDPATGSGIMVTGRSHPRNSQVAPCGVSRAAPGTR